MTRYKTYKVTVLKGYIGFLRIESFKQYKTLTSFMIKCVCIFIVYCLDLIGR